VCVREREIERENLHSGTIGHGLIRVDALAGLLAVEEAGDELLHLGDARGAANQHDFVNLKRIINYNNARR
jgi:hypothetical protein